MENATGGGQLVALLRGIWTNKVHRYLLLTPTAIASIAGIKELGETAQWVVSLWLPTMQLVGRFILFLPLPEFLKGQAGVMVVFFTPFSVMGIVDVVRGRDKNVTRGLLFVSMLAFSFLLFLSIGIPKIHEYSLRHFMALFFMYFIMPIPLFVAFLGVTIRVNNVPDRGLSVASLPLFVATMTGMFVFAIAGVQHWKGNYGTAIVFVLVAAMPFFSPRRLIDTAVVAMGIILFSLVAKFLQYVVSAA
ncbi:hypothetical protein BH10PLA2_BH10PLA2_00280 [soil metagenome]